MRVKAEEQILLANILHDSLYVVHKNIVSRNSSMEISSIEHPITLLNFERSEVKNDLFLIFLQYFMLTIHTTLIRIIVIRLFVNF